MQRVGHIQEESGVTLQPKATSVLEAGMKPARPAAAAHKAAQPGSITRETSGLLLQLKAFYEARDRLVEDLVGKRYGQSRRREELIRSIVVNFSDGRLRRIADYEQQLRDFGSPSSIRSEIQVLLEVGLIILRQDPEDRRRSAIVYPTNKLVDFYNIHLSKLWCDTIASVKGTAS